MPFFIGSEAVQRTNKESKGTSRQTSYLIKMNTRYQQLELFEAHRLNHSATSHSNRVLHFTK